MTQENSLNESDIDTLINLLLRSQQSRTREALCFSIGIDPKRLSFIRDSSDSDFFLLLVRHLNEIDDQEALCKLCCKELLSVFPHGKYADILSNIAAKLNCNYDFEQNSPNKTLEHLPSNNTPPVTKNNKQNSFRVFWTILSGIIIVVAPFYYTLKSEDNFIDETIKVSATSREGTLYKFKGEKPAKVQFKATGNWLAIRLDFNQEENLPKGFTSANGYPEFRGNLNRPCFTESFLAALAVTTSDGSKCLAHGSEGTLDLKPGDRVNFVMSDTDYHDNKGEMTVELFKAKK